jgi:hypothetical protein
MAEKRSSYQWLQDIHVPTPADHPDWITPLDETTSPDDVHVNVVVREVALGQGERTMEDGAVVTVGVPLRVMRDDIGGDEGIVYDPATNQPHRISLKKWKHRDPDTTLIQVAFIVKSKKKIKE